MDRRRYGGRCGGGSSSITFTKHARVQRVRELAQHLAVLESLAEGAGAARGGGSGQRMACVGHLVDEAGSRAQRLRVTLSALQRHAIIGATTGGSARWHPGRARRQHFASLLFE